MCLTFLCKWCRDIYCAHSKWKIVKRTSKIYKKPCMIGYFIICRWNSQFEVYTIALAILRCVDIPCNHQLPGLSRRKSIHFTTISSRDDYTNTSQFTTHLNIVYNETLITHRFSRNPLPPGNFCLSVGMIWLYLSIRISALPLNTHTLTISLYPFPKLSPQSVEREMFSAALADSHQTVVYSWFRPRTTEVEKNLGRYHKHAASHFLVFFILPWFTDQLPYHIMLLHGILGIFACLWL